MTYEPNIKDRVRIALALTILNGKDYDEDVEGGTDILHLNQSQQIDLESNTDDSVRTGCVLRLRDTFLQLDHQQYTFPESRICVLEHNRTIQTQTERWFKLVRELNTQVSSLQCQIAEKDIDLSIAQTDREAAQHRPPVQKRPRKTTVLSDKTNLPAPTPDINRAAGENEDPSTMIKKKAGPGSRGKGKEKKGVKEEEILALCERLDESLESHIRKLRTVPPVQLLFNILNAPQEISHPMPPIRLQAILAHSRRIIQSLSFYLEKCVHQDASAILSRVGGDIGVIRSPRGMLKIITYLAQHVLSAVAHSVKEILKGMDIPVDGEEAAVLGIRRVWSDMIILITKTLIKPALVAMSNSNGPTQTATVNSNEFKRKREDLRINFMKLIICLGQIDLSLDEDPEHALAEGGALLAMSHLIKLVQCDTLGVVELQVKRECARILIDTIRCLIPYLPLRREALQFSDSSRGSYQYDILNMSQSSPGSTKNPPEFLLNMSIRTKLVQIVSPAEGPLAFLDSASTGIFEDPSLRAILYNMVEELMLSEDEEQGIIANTIISLSHRTPMSARADSDREVPTGPTQDEEERDMTTNQTEMESLNRLQTGCEYVQTMVTVPPNNVNLQNVSYTVNDADVAQMDSTVLLAVESFCDESASKDMGLVSGPPQNSPQICQDVSKPANIALEAIPALGVVYQAENDIEMA